RDHTQNIWALRERSSFFRKASAQPTQLTVGPLLFSNPTPSLDGKKLFVIGQQRRFDLIRLQGKSEQFSISLPGVSAGEADILPGGEWMVYVAQQTGWQLANSTYLFPDAGAHATLVVRWKADRIYGLASRKALEDFCDAGRGRHAPGSNRGRSQPGRPHVDAERRCDCLRRHALAG